MKQSHKHSTEISTLQSTVKELQDANSVLQIQVSSFVCTPLCLSDANCGRNIFIKIIYNIIYEINLN